MLDTALIDGLVAEVLPLVVEVRRAIHRHPELSGEEYATTDLLSGILRDHGVFPRLRTPQPGLIADVGEGDRIVAFRGDLDGLPIQEPDGNAVRSSIPGVMHACGHDAHAAMALGVALVAARIDLGGRVRVIFQPAEETFPGGAYELLKEGVLDGVEAILAFHVDPGLATGSVGLKHGAITSSADRFFITLEGPGGHTARPHQTVDLIYVAGQVITQLPALMDRLVDARSPLTLVFGRIHGGTADNVIPTIVEMSGTLRTPDRDVWDVLPSLVDRLVRDIASPLGAKMTAHYQRGIPPVINNSAVVHSVEKSAERMLGEDRLVPTHVSMGAEDFARYLEDIPGALVRLGCSLEKTRTDLHSAGFVLDEACLETGLRVGVAAVADLLG